MTPFAPGAQDPGSWFGLSLPIVVAEIGGNHNGDLALARRMIDAVAEAGGGVAKFQAYHTSQWISAADPSYDEFAREELPDEAWSELAARCQAKHVVFLATPFDRTSVDRLAALGVPAFKIASGDLTNRPFLRYVAEKDRPVLLSTGASTLDEVDAAVETIREASNAGLLLLHCTAAYPTRDEEANLTVIPAMAERYGCPVGFSDHTAGVEITLAAVALGAVLVEKHFTIDRSLPGGDNAMSILPVELRALVEGSRRILASLGRAERLVTPSEQALVGAIRRSLAVRRDVKSGESLFRENLFELRPGTGIPASAVEEVTGRTARLPLHAGQILHWDDLA
jgi:N-acetylneuraminate synthase/N,N'-diacetyllegionaminate synthase